MRVYITEELAQYRHTSNQDISHYCLVAQALKMQLPLPDEYHWSVGLTKAYIQDGRGSTVEAIDLPPPVRRLIRGYDDGIKPKITFFQI